MNNKGQAILAEYVMIFFVVIAALVGMTVFVQRSLEARVHDARNYLTSSVVNSGACDANCVAAAGGSINPEYEPYYAQIFSNVFQDEQSTKGATSGNPAVIGVKYIKSINETTSGGSTSYQLPSGCADGANPRPAYCPQF